MEILLTISCKFYHLLAENLENIVDMTLIWFHGTLLLNNKLNYIARNFRWN